MLISGDELRAVFGACSPFDENGNLKPDEERKTVLAANANMPLEIFGRAMVMASAADDGSPIIVQMSHSALRMVGGAQTTIVPIKGAQRHEQPNALVAGAAIAAALLDEFADHYRAPLVAMSLDHFKVPSFVDNHTLSPSASRKLAKARLEDALEAASQTLENRDLPTKTQLERYTDYLCSEQYKEFKTDFLGVVLAASPAWGMIDTEQLPPVLNYAVTREISDSVRRDLGNTDMMLEAEYGATGQSGDAQPYQKLEGAELARFADEVAAFVDYTRSDGIAYPIGMEHAARKEERHPPDTKRLVRVQSRILEKTGRYVPFAQHGGTGAAYLARGLVGKNNVNTQFLVAGATALLGWTNAHEAGILAGEKKSAGTDIYLTILRAIAEECVNKLIEAGTYGDAENCLEFMREGV